MANLPPRPPDENVLAQSEDALGELRSLLFGREKSNLDRIQKRLDDPQVHALDVSQVLPMAIRHRTRQDDQLVPALRSTVEEILQQSVKRNPQAIIQVLFPIIGPAIRKAISSALRNLMQNLQRTLDLSLSPRSIRWRMEALRTGRPFSEVVLLHTLRFQVEQIFLIHRKNGLVLHHVVAGAAPSKDPDLVSAMLTAIQDFVSDSFELSAAGGLETLEVGDLSIWIERGPSAVLAAVIRGNAPPELREDLQGCLEEVHLEFQPHLDEFEGDATPFETCRPLLESCLQSELLQPELKEGAQDSSQSPILLWVGFGVVVLLLSLWLWSSYQTRSQWASLVNRLEEKPGIVVTQATREGGRFQLRGLRDPLSEDPAALIEASALGQVVQAEWEPFLALEPEIVKRRVQHLLAPPSGVQFELEGDLLTLSGSAPAEWIEQVRDRGLRVPGIARLETARLVEADGLGPIREALQSRELAFSEGTQWSEATEGELEAIRSLLDRLQEWAERRQQRVGVTLIGNTDSTGSPQFNAELGRRRAGAVLQRLRRTAGAWPRLSFQTTSSVERGEPTANRSVSFQVELAETGQ